MIGLTKPNQLVNNENEPSAIMAAKGEEEDIPSTEEKHRMMGRIVIRCFRRERERIMAAKGEEEDILSTKEKHRMMGRIVIRCFRREPQIL